MDRVGMGSHPGPGTGPPARGKQGGCIGGAAVGHLSTKRRGEILLARASPHLTLSERATQFQAGGAIDVVNPEYVGW